MKQQVFQLHGVSDKYNLGLTVLSVMQVATPLGEKVHSKASMDMDQGITKKFKRLDGLAVPVGNGSTEDVAGGSVCELSQRFVGLNPFLLLLIFLEANCPNQVNFKMMENSLHASCSWL